MGMEHATGVGARIRACRLARGLSASTLAVRAGVTENAIRKIESGDSKEPRFSTGVRIAAALGVEPKELVPQTRVERLGAPELGAVLQHIRAQRAQLSKRGIKHIAVFGSVARGEATPNSDVDVIIEPSPSRRFTLLDLAAAQELLENLLGRKVDAVTLTTLRRSSFGRKSEKEAVRAF